MADHCLSIFIDESGDFGFADGASDYYLFTMVFHDQAESIEEAVKHLDYELTQLGYPHHTVHTGPIIRQEEDYQLVHLGERRKLLFTMRKFTRHVSVKAHTIIIDKECVSSTSELQARIARELGNSIKVPAYNLVLR